MGGSDIGDALRGPATPSRERTSIAVMDPVLRSALQALRAGEPLAVLQRTALRTDGPALALRGIACAQLGDLARSAACLQRALATLGRQERSWRAGCLAAAGDVALAERDLPRAGRLLERAERALRRADAPDLAHVRLLQARRALLLGRVDAAGTTLATLASLPMTLPTQALALALAGEIALRRRRVPDAEAAFAAARAVAVRTGFGNLVAEIERAAAALAQPAARLATRAGARPCTLAEVAAVGDDGALVVDGCQRHVRAGHRQLSLRRRSVLWTLLQCLAIAAPADVSRDELVVAAFGARRADDSHRARLRVEMARLRAMLRPFAGLHATARGFQLQVHAGAVHVLLPPLDSPAAAVLALLADGCAWSTASLAQALGSSQRTVQRALAELGDAGQVERRGAGRRQRWTIAPLVPFATCMLLPSPGPIA